MRVPRLKRTILVVGGSGCALFLLNSYFFSRPRILAVSEVPIAFWAWRTQAPRDAEVQKAFTATNTKILFLRAGQFDFANGSVGRIRPVSGPLPSAVELHLVYNGTRRFLREWEQVDAGSFAEQIAETYRADLSRSQIDHANILGLQLDFDVPTRLLPKYGQLLHRIRELLPSDTKLSITGLPTWTLVPDIRLVLDAVDFWIPQCYGTSIPTHVSERIPILSSTEVERTISKVRDLGKPFYAGLAAYSYAILYAKDGSLIELRGDLDPASAAQNADLESIESQTFKGDSQSGETRYVYRAKSDVVLDGLIIQPGETLVFDVPNAASLRAAARAVRENAGDRLLGICVFRLPAADDATTLSVGEIAAALTDTQTKVATAITLNKTPGGQLKLSAANTGSAGTILADDALAIDLSIPLGSISGASGIAGFAAYETLCGHIGIEDPQPCSPLRANILRLKVRSWMPGNKASAMLSSKTPLPSELPAMITTRVSDGRIERQILDLNIKSSEN